MKGTAFLSALVYAVSLGSLWEPREIGAELTQVLGFEHRVV